VIDAAYAMQYDAAIHADEMAGMGGEKTTHLEDFLAEMHYRHIPDSPSFGGGASITDLRAFVANVNAKMGGREA
jgi:hypothetical protein